MTRRCLAGPHIVETIVTDVVAFVLAGGMPTGHGRPTDYRSMTRLSQEEWRISECSSEETENGPMAPEYAPAAAVIDGKGVSTCWHSRWTRQPTSHPHYIVIDLGSNQEVHRFSFQHFLNEGRQPHRGIKDMDLLMSLDGDKFDLINSYELEYTGTPQLFDLPESKILRYLKIVANSAWDGEQFACFAEVNLFRNKTGRVRRAGSPLYNVALHSVLTPFLISRYREGQPGRISRRAGGHLGRRFVPSSRGSDSRRGDRKTAPRFRLHRRGARRSRHPRTRPGAHPRRRQGNLPPASRPADLSSAR